MGYRAARIQEQIKKTIGKMLIEKINDPRLGFVSVTEVEVSRDYSVAKVYFSVLGAEESKEQSMKVLNGSKGFIRSEVGRALGTRVTPELAFFLDRSLDHAEEMDRLMKRLDQEPDEDDTN